MSLMMSGFDRLHTPPRSVLRASGSAQGMTAWALLDLSRTGDATCAAWADKTLESIVAGATARYRGVLDCADCEDLGFYGKADATDPDILTTLVRRRDEHDYETLTASGAWVPFTDDGVALEVLDREVADALADAVTAGASGLVRRYCWPKAFLPPMSLLAAAPASNALADAASGDWRTYAVVDDLDPGAVTDLIRLAPGPKLEAYLNGTWTAEPALLSSLQGTDPPSLVELEGEQLDDVTRQVQATEAADAAAGDQEQSSAAVATTAAASLTVSPDPRAEKLRRYWSVGGKGGLKIKWGLPGDWKRCYRHLAKFMGLRAKGYCQNLHKRNTGLWTGSRLNASGASSVSTGHTALTTEHALLASVRRGHWLGQATQGDEMALKDGVYAEVESDAALLNALVAGGFPVAPPDEWFEDPGLAGPTPLTVSDDGRVSGHIATFDVAHIGLPGRVHAPKNRTNYAYFQTGEVVTASGKKVNVGQLTLAGGHAPLRADAAAAVKHYDDTASAVADVRAGEDKYGIWVSGALRPEITPVQLRALRASAPSGDWRPINGNLELVACCQVNVPGFPVARAFVASGAITALVAAGSRPLAARQMALMADAAVVERLTALESHVFGVDTGPDLVESEDGTVLADGVAVAEVPVETVTGEAPASTEPATTETTDAATTEPEVAVDPKIAAARAAVTTRRMAALRTRVHGATV